jgi:phospholipase/carboxylesterase
VEPQLLRYRISLPAAPVADHHPLLILLHGRGTDESDLLDISSYLDSRLLSAGIRAPLAFQYGGYTWFDLEENGKIDPAQLISSCSSVIKTIEEICMKNAVDLSRIFLFGFSMGAMMSLALSLIHPGKFRGVIAHSGMLPDFIEIPPGLNNTSYFLAHGLFDPVVPVELGRKAYEKLKGFPPKIIYREYPIQHTISDESLSDISAWLRELI